MSNLDYSNGLAAGYAHSAATTKRAEQTVGRWQEFSGRLESKLLNEEVERMVAVEYVKALRAALKHFSPGHPLLNAADAEKFLNGVRVKAFADKGFDYDQSTNNLSPRR